MKQELDNSKVYLDQDELKVLVREVRETVAADIIEKENSNKPIFSAADLWNIRRKKTPKPELFPDKWMKKPNAAVMTR